MILNKKLFEFVEQEIEEFNSKTKEEYDVSMEDVFYSYLYSTNTEFHVLNDWDEGEGSDDFWNKEANEHCVIFFLKEVCKKLKQEYEIRR